MSKLNLKESCNELCSHLAMSACLFSRTWVAYRSHQSGRNVTSQLDSWQLQLSRGPPGAARLLAQVQLVQLEAPCFCWRPVVAPPLSQLARHVVELPGQVSVRRYVDEASAGQHGGRALARKNRERALGGPHRACVLAGGQVQREPPGQHGAQDRAEQQGGLQQVDLLGSSWAFPARRFAETPGYWRRRSHVVPTSNHSISYFLISFHSFPFTILCIAWIQLLVQERRAAFVDECIIKRHNA